MEMTYAALLCLCFTSVSGRAFQRARAPSAEVSRCMESLPLSDWPGRHHMTSTGSKSESRIWETHGVTAMTQRQTKRGGRERHSKVRRILSLVLQGKFVPLWNWNALLLNYVLLPNKDSWTRHTSNNMWTRSAVTTFLYANSSECLGHCASSSFLCRRRRKETKHGLGLAFLKRWFRSVFFFFGIVSAVCSMKWNLAGPNHFH